MKHNGMANRANRGIRDDVSYEVVFWESMTASYVMICSSCLRGTATHGAQWQFFRVKDHKGNYRDIPGNWNQYAGYFPLWRLSYSIIPLYPHEVRAERAWIISEKSLANCELWR